MRGRNGYKQGDETKIKGAELNRRRIKIKREMAKMWEDAA